MAVSELSLRLKAAVLFLQLVDVNDPGNAFGEVRREVWMRDQIFERPLR